MIVGFMILGGPAFIGHEPVVVSVTKKLSGVCSTKPELLIKDSLARVP